METAQRKKIARSLSLLKIEKVFLVCQQLLKEARSIEHMTFSRETFGNFAYLFSSLAMMGTFTLFGRDVPSASSVWGETERAKKVYHNYFVPLLPPMDSRDPLAPPPPPIRPGTRFAVYQ